MHFRSPKERTPGYIDVKVTNDGKPLTYLERTFEKANCVHADIAHDCKLLTVKKRSRSKSGE